jgi:hypothetical protein
MELTTPSQQLLLRNHGEGQDPYRVVGPVEEKWVSVDEDLECKKIIKCTNVLRLNNVRKYSVKGQCK